MAATALIFLLAFGIAQEGAIDVSIGDLLDEMADLPGWTGYPDPPYIALQASSYDPRSETPEDPAGWFANGDAGNYLRVEEAEDGGKRYVMMEAEGPGAVTRIWSANPKGTLRIHIDGQTVLEAPMGDVLRGKHEAFPEPFAYEASRGCNLYFPFAYQESCKITSDEGGFYYQVGYRKYAEGTSVEATLPSHVVGRDERTRAKLHSVKQGLANRHKAPFRGLDVDTGRTHFESGRAEVKAPDGGAVAYTLVVGAGGLDAEALRQTVISIRFDGIETVRAPLGDFFGSGPGANPYDSAPFSMHVTGAFFCRWYMPFRESMEVVFEGEAAKDLDGHVRWAGMPWNDRSMYFHAVWRSEYDIPTEKQRDWNYVTVEGKGVYVGNVLNVANPVRNWWGEGDEKIYVDGETFPSHFGTGTEDYYGYAWCCPEPFQRPYHAQTRCDGPGNYGHTSVNRWHIIDPIPFEKSFRFDMEVWHHRRDTSVGYETVNYFYAMPGAKVNREPLEVKDLKIPEIPELVYKVIPGAIEGEGLKAVITSGYASPQDLASFGAGKWSRDTHLWWRQAKVGDTLKLTFGAPEAGRYKVMLYLTKGPDYGKHAIRMGDTEKEIDLWNEGVVPADVLELGTFDLQKAGNEIVVEIIGTNPKAIPAYMFGLDCLVLEKE